MLLLFHPSLAASVNTGTYTVHYETGKDESGPEFKHKNTCILRHLGFDPKFAMDRRC